jgi:hypothetical protein
LEQLKPIYDQYGEDVDFYAVGVFPGDDVAPFVKFAKERNYPWPVAVPEGQLLEDLYVTIQSTKIAINRHGTIVHRAGMGRGSPEIWRRVFTDLTAQS